MEKFEYKEYKICVYMDVMEYANEFWEVPEGAYVDEDDARECHGHADPDNKELFIYVPEFPMISNRDLWATVAHELGHIIEFQYDPIPVSVSFDDPRGEEKAMAHENRAEFFENFFLDVLNISQMILDIRSKLLWT